MGELLYYNAAAGSFHIKKLYNILCSIKIEFYLKNKKSLLSRPLGDLGVTYMLHRWKARGRFLFVIFELFAISYV